jgi:hypothetical protein
MGHRLPFNLAQGLAGPSWRRNNWRFIGPGTGMHGPDIDEDISVGGFLGLPD